MKKIIFFTALFAALASCQKNVRFEKKQIAEIQNNDVIDGPPPIVSAKTQGLINQALRRCNTNPSAPYSGQLIFEAAETVPTTMTFDVQGRGIAKYTQVFVYISNKEIYLPAICKFVPGDNSSSDPVIDSSKFLIQFAIMNEQAAMVDGSFGYGNLYSGMYWATTQIVSGGQRMPTGEIKVRPGMPVYVQIKSTISEQLTTTPPIEAADQKYRIKELGITGKFNLNPDSKTVNLLTAANSNNTVSNENDPAFSPEH